MAKDLIIVFIAIVAMALAGRGVLYLYYDVNTQENATVTEVIQ